MSQTLQNQILYAKSMNGIVTLSDGAGTVIENGAISTGGLNATSIYSDEYNTRGKSKMESTIIIAASSTPYTISYGTAQNIVFTGAVVQTVNLPVVQLANMGATFTILRTSAVQMIIQAPSGYNFYDENNSFQTGITLFSNTRIVTFTAINTTASPAMWAMTYSQDGNKNLVVNISGTQNISGTKTFSGTTSFSTLLPSFTGTLPGTVASTNLITRGYADTSYERKSFGTINTTATLTATSPNNLYVSRPSADYTITLPDVSTLSVGYSYNFILNLPDFATVTNTVEILTYDMLNQLVNTTAGGGTGNFPMNGQLISLTIECISTASSGIVWNIVQTNANNNALVYADYNVTQYINGNKIFDDSVVFTGDTQFLYQSGGVYPYFNPNGMAPPTPTTHSFLTKQWGDTYYARLANPNVFINDNTFTLLTTFTGSINANSNTITPTQLGYISGATENIQSQLNNRVTLNTTETITGAKTFQGTTTFTGSIIANALTITPTQLGYLSGVTSAIQTQLNNRVTLDTSQTITGAKTMNANFTISTSGYLLPLFPLSSTSMRMGLNSMQYSNAGCVDNIVFGINAMQGTTNGAYNNLSVRNVVIGTEAYQNTTYGTANSTHNDNVIIGYQAMKQHYYNNYDNVCIGSQNCKGGTGSLKSVMIGSKISVNSGQHTYSVIIGADNFPSTAINNGTIVGYGNFALSTLTYANGLIIFGDGNMRSCVTFNRAICVGSGSLTSLNSQYSTICIGTESLTGLSTGGYVSCIGSFITTTNNSLTNTTIIGTGSTTGLNNVCYIGGNDRTGTPVYQDLLPAWKTKLLTQTSYNTATVNLTFEVGEHINLDTDVSIVNLPLVTAKNIGARFCFYRDFISTTCTLTASNSFGLINNTGASATTYVIPAFKCYATIVATAVQPTSGPAEVCWFLINEDLNNEVSMIESDVTTLDYNTTAITYDDTVSPAYTSITSQLRLNNNAVKFQTSATLSGTVGSLTTPLNSFYVLSGATGSLTLPTITTDLIAVRISFVKQNATGTWTLSTSSTDTFRFQGSVTTATSLPMTNSWTMCELIAESGVWNIINQNSGVDGFYYRNEISPTNITATITSWTNPIYENYLVNNTGNITISLPLSSQVFIGLVLRFRKIGTLAAQVTMNIQAGSGQTIKFAGATANTTTGTLLNATQTFASVMYISSNLWAVLG